MDEKYELELDELDEPAWIRGEKEMLAAILERGYEDLYLTLERAAAVEWFCDEAATTDDEFSFPWVLFQLDLDVELWQEKTRKLIDETVGAGYADRIKRAVTITIPGYRQAYRAARSITRRKPGRPAWVNTRLFGESDAA